MIEEIEIDSKKWNQVVKSFENYDVFYLQEYARAFQFHGDGIPVLLYYEAGKERAINVIFKRDIGLDTKSGLRGKIPEKTYFDISTPYGYGGFRGNISNYEKLQTVYRKYCKEQKFISEFVRFDLFSDYSHHYDGEVEHCMHNAVRDLDMSLDDIWMDFKQKVRKNVKRAIANDLTIIRDLEGKYLETFLEVYYGTMDRSQASSNYYFRREFFVMLNEMKENVIYFHVMYEGKIISTELVIYGSESCYSYLGGTDRSYFQLRPNDFLKYEIIKWAKEKGLKRFVLGGGYGKDDGIFQYKLSLAPNGEKIFSVGKKVLDEKRYRGLVELKKEICGGETGKQGFFPMYRN